MARYGGDFGSAYRTDDNRDRWRDEDRERSSWRAGSQGSSERDDERGFFQRAGDEIRSWFNEDDDRSSENYGRPGTSWDRERRTGFSDTNRERSYGGSRNVYEGHREFGRPSRSWDSERERGFGQSRSPGSWTPSSNRDRLGSSSRDFGGFRDESDFRGHRQNRPQGQSSWDRDRDQHREYGLSNAHLGYGDFSGTLGGFGNQTFGSSEHDHYRNWRDRELAKLDRDYDDYCREREHQFNQDLDSWRRDRQSRNPTASASSPDMGSSSNSGVGTTTASMTGSAGTGSAAASATGAGGTIQSDASSTETGGGGRSGSRSRS